MSNEGNYDAALRLLAQMQENNKIQMQENPQPNVSLIDNLN